MPSPVVYKAGGHWNTFEIEARGPYVTVKFNGVLTAAMNNGKLPSGSFALQFGAGVNGALSGPIKWRKLQVRAL